VSSPEPLPAFASVRAILFDFGGTLDGDGLHWLIRFYDLYPRMGFHFSRDQIRAAFDEAERHFRAEGAIDSSLAGTSVQEMVERHLAAQFTHLQINDGEREKECVREFVRAIRLAAARNVEILRQLSARDFRLGVLSNGCGNTTVLCQELGFSAYLELICDSVVIGLRKPDPKFHAYAAAQLRLPAEEILIVGDSLERDIHPGRLIGMRTAWVTPDVAQVGAADAVISSLGELLRLLPLSPADSSPVKGGIFAAGQGSRLRDAATLKPLAKIADRPLIEHVLENFASAGIKQVVVIINEQSLAVERAIREREWPFDLQWIVKTTASSMESFLRLIEALAENGEPGRFLVSTVDTVLAPGELVRFLREARRISADVVLAVNEQAADENPLWLNCGPDGRQVSAVGESARGSGLATAGLYLVRRSILSEAESARKEQLPSLRQFLARLLVRGHALAAVRIANSIDVDRPADIIAAEEFVRQKVS
jgi:putative hydrolase of the HAD superfamily